jgi:RsiW-degrading membrane proteinase PrsW (M82 family)
MVQAIGLVICAYVITKMCVLIFPSKKEKETGESPSAVVVVLAFLTIVMTVFAIYVLISQGASISQQMDLLK